MLLDIFLLLACLAVILGVALSMKRRRFAFFRRLGDYFGDFKAAMRQRLQRGNRWGFVLPCAAVVLLALYFTLTAIRRGSALPWSLCFLCSLAAMVAAYGVVCLLLYLYFRSMRNYFGMVPLAFRRLVVLLSIVLLVLLLQPRLSEVQATVLLLCTVLFYFFNFFNMLQLLRLAWRGSLSMRQMWNTVFVVLIVFFVVFAAMFYGASLCVDHAFNQAISFLDAAYYTTVCFVTIGFGDIVPTHDVTKVLTILCAVTSVICLVFLVNSVLSLSSKAKSAERAGEDAGALPEDTPPHDTP